MRIYNPLFVMVNSALCFSVSFAMENPNQPNGLPALPRMAPIEYQGNRFLQGCCAASVDSLGRTALHDLALQQSITPEHIKNAECLLVNGVQLNVPDVYRRTPLHYAALNKQSELLCLFLNNKADPGQRDNDGKTAFDLTTDPLCKALLQLCNTLGRVQKACLDNGFDLIESLRADSCLQKDLRCEQPSHMFRFLVRNIPVDMVGPHCHYTALHCAVLANNLEASTLLLDRKADPDSRDANQETPLHYAASNNFYELLCLLLSRQAHADVCNVRGQTPFDVANPWCKTLLQLLRATEHSAKLIIEDKDSCLPILLQKASIDGYIYTLKFLLNHYVSANLKEIGTQYTPLHFAAMGNQVKAAESLLDHGACIEGRDYLGFTPLARAVNKDFYEVAQLLYQRGAFLLARLKSDTSIVQLASRAKSHDLRFLINGAIIKYQQEKGIKEIECPWCGKKEKEFILRSCGHLMCMKCQEEWKKLCPWCAPNKQ